MHIIETATTINETSSTKDEIIRETTNKPKNAIEAFGNLMKNKKTRIIRRIKK